MMQCIKLQPITDWVKGLNEWSGSVNWAFFQKPTNTSERASPLLQLTSLNSEVILRELSNDYRVDFKMMQNKRLVETQVSGYRLQFPGYMLQVNLGKPCQTFNQAIFDGCLIGFTHLENPCLMMFNEKYLLDDRTRVYSKINSSCKIFLFIILNFMFNAFPLFSWNISPNIIKQYLFDCLTGSPGPLEVAGCMLTELHVIKCTFNIRHKKGDFSFYWAGSQLWG